MGSYCFETILESNETTRQEIEQKIIYQKHSKYYYSNKYYSFKLTDDQQKKCSSSAQCSDSIKKYFYIIYLYFLCVLYWYKEHSIFRWRSKEWRPMLSDWEAQYAKLLSCKTTCGVHQLLDCILSIKTRCLHNGQPLEINFSKIIFFCCLLTLPPYFRFRIRNRKYLMHYPQRLQKKKKRNVVYLNFLMFCVLFPWRV